MPDETAERASAKLPESHPLYAPGLERRSRANGEARLWRALKSDRRNGYLPQSLRFPDDLDEHQIAERCRVQWQDLIDWRTGKTKEVKYTIGWLIDDYLTNSDSEFHEKGANTQANYRNECKHIREVIGTIRFDPERQGNAFIPRLRLTDFKRWWREFGNTVEWKDPNGNVVKKNGKPVMVATTPSRQRHLFMMVRTLFQHGIGIGAPGASMCYEMIASKEWAQTKSRTRRPTRDEVIVFVDKAVEMGHPSVAICTLAAFELNERRISILGDWRRDTDTPRLGWEWREMSSDWIITYSQEKTGTNLRRYDLRPVQKLLGLLQAVPVSERFGPVIKSEATGRQYKYRHYNQVFKEIRIAAGLPDGWWSMDMRAGGVSEADGIEGVTDRQLQDSAGHGDPRTTSIYRRDKIRNAQNVVELRQAANRAGTKKNDA